MKNEDDIDLEVFRELPVEMQKQVVLQLEERKRATNALTPSPIIPVKGLSPSTPSPYSSPVSVSSASPIEFSQMQLQSILRKGKTVRKITEMKDIMQNGTWKSVPSRSGEYQVLVNSNTPM